jgi:hypothetical protein
MDHAAAMGVGDGVADAEEGLQERPEFERVDPALGASMLGRLDRLGEGAALDEPHRIEWFAALACPDELMDRDDVGMLKLAGDLGLFQEAGPDDRIIRLLGPQFLEGDLATEVGVARQPDLAHAALRVESGQGITLVSLGCVVDRRDQNMALGRLGPGDRSAELGVADLRHRLSDRIAGHLGQGGVDIAAVPAEFAIDQSLHIGAILGRDPTPLREHVGERALLLAGPEGTAVDELRPRDRVGLQGNHTEQEITVNIGTFHALALGRGNASP